MCEFQVPDMLRLGFSVRVVGQPTLRSHDGRRSAAHLSVSLVYLRDILIYLQQIHVHFYRLSSTLTPYVSLEHVLRQLEDCSAELAMLAHQARTQGVRLTLHLGHNIALGSTDAEGAARSLAVIEGQAALLERLEDGRLPGEQLGGVLVAHVGGSKDGQSALRLFVKRYMALSERARVRLAIEHDTCFSIGQVLQIHQACGVPVVFDLLHWQIYNPECLSLDLALGLTLASWPVWRRAEVHLSSARSEAHVMPAGQNGPARVLPPRTGQHADFIASPDALQLLRAARGLPAFDIMLEAKAGDLALLRMRAEVERLAPDLAAQLR